MSRGRKSKAGGTLLPLQTRRPDSHKKKNNSRRGNTVARFPLFLVLVIVARGPRPILFECDALAFHHVPLLPPFYCFPTRVGLVRLKPRKT